MTNMNVTQKYFQHQWKFSFPKWTCIVLLNHTILIYACYMLGMYFLKFNITKVIWAKNYYPHYTDEIGEAQKAQYVVQDHTASKSWS